ncbi:MAG: hypothetical protein J2P46_12365 [Zavarzinella sp.]|nr:hypothetical protein [Zavarzinella sp.]
MAKLALFPVLLAAGCVIAGLYGAVHDQVSYTVSPDYFHAFKFHQFGIPAEQHDRVGAAVVGWRASWWMGLVIGPPVLLVGLVLPDARAYLTRSLAAFAVVAATALAAGLGALAYASATVTAADAPGYWVPDGVADPVAFVRVGIMHSFSYLGGLFGIVTACIYLLLARVRLARRPAVAADPGRR